MQLRDGEGGGGGGDAETRSTGEKRKFGGGKRKSGKNSRLLAKAKKFAKQGRLGRGFEVDSETYNYFLQVLELWQKNEFGSDEERETFVENSFSQTEGNEVNYSSNQMTSRVIETILPSASESVILRFGAAFAPSLRTLCADPFASHVVEKLLEVSSSEKWAKESPKLTEWFRQTSRYVLNNLEEFTFDPYANHVMRKVAQCLTGFVQETGQAAIQQQNQPDQKQKPGRKSVSNSGTEVFGERTRNRKNEEIFNDFYQRFLAWPQFFDLFGSELTSGLVQIVLKTCARVDPSVLQISLVDGIRKVCKAIGDELDLSNATHANLHTRLLEVCLPLSEETWGHIFSKYFKGRLSSVGVHEKGKFSLKKVIETCPTKEEFETIFDEIQPSFGAFFKAQVTSPFVSVAVGCKKFATRQSQFIQALTEIIDATDDKGDNFIMNLARFGGKLELKEDGTPKYLTQFVGTMIIQNLVEFHKPLKVVSSLLDMDGNSLSKLIVDPKGSHIVDAFFKSETIGEKNKEKMLNKLKEYLPTFALNKFGSRVIDTIWGWASMKHKSTIASCLVDRLAQLNAHQFGKFLAEKCGLHVFKRDPKLWAESLEKGDKRLKEANDVLSELLGDDAVKQDDGEEEESSKKKSHKKKHKKSKPEVKEDPEELEEAKEVDEPEVRRKKKKSKKDKLDKEEIAPEMEVDQEEEIAPAKSNKKKKNKRKHKDSEENAEHEALDSTTIIDDTEKDHKEERKKRKKEAKKMNRTMEDME